MTIPETCKSLQNIIKTKTSVASSVGASFTAQLGRHTVFAPAPTGLDAPNAGVRYPRLERHALTWLIILAIALVVVPEAINRDLPW